MAVETWARIPAATYLLFLFFLKNHLICWVNKDHRGDKELHKIINSEGRYNVLTIIIFQEKVNKLT